jgi:hypothetical protein
MRRFPLAQPAITQDFDRYLLASLTDIEPLCLLSNLQMRDRYALGEQLRTRWEALQKTPSTPQVRNLRLIQLILPWSEKPAAAFFYRFIDILGLESVVAAVQKAYEEGLDKQTATLHLDLSARNNTYILDVLDMLDEGIELSTNTSLENQARELAMKTFLTGTCSPAQLGKLGLARNMTLQERYILLSSLWECMINPTPSQQLKDHTRLWIWIDHLEHLLDYSEKDCREMVRGLTFLISTIATSLTVWLNITAQGEPALSKIKRLLGEEFMDLVDQDLTRQVLYPLPAAIPDNSHQDA